MVERADISQVLAQMRMVQSQINRPPAEIIQRDRPHIGVARLLRAQRDRTGQRRQRLRLAARPDQGQGEAELRLGRGRMRGGGVRQGCNGLGMAPEAPLQIAEMGQGGQEIRVQKGHDTLSDLPLEIGRELFAYWEPGDGHVIAEG